MASPSNFYLIPVHPLPSILCVPFYLLSFISSFSFKPIHIIIGALESGSFSPLLPMPLVLAFWLKKSSSFPLFFHFLSPCSSDHWQYYPLSLSTPFSITTYFPHAVSGQCDIHSPPLNITTVHSLPRCQGKGKDNSLKCLSPGSYSGYLPRARPCNRPEDKEMWNPWKLGKGRKDMGYKKEEKERERTDHQTYIAEIPLSASSVQAAMLLHFRCLLHWSISSGSQTFWLRHTHTDILYCGPSKVLASNA